MFNEVHAKALADEWESARRPQIALNDFHFVVLADELDVKWTFGPLTHADKHNRKLEATNTMRSNKV